MSVDMPVPLNWERRLCIARSKEPGSARLTDFGQGPETSVVRKRLVDVALEMSPRRAPILRDTTSSSSERTLAMYGSS